MIFSRWTVVDVSKERVRKKKKRLAMRKKSSVFFLFCSFLVSDAVLE